MSIVPVVQDRRILNRLRSGDRNLQRGTGKPQHLRWAGAVSNRAYDRQERRPQTVDSKQPPANYLISSQSIAETEENVKLKRNLLFFAEHRKNPANPANPGNPASDNQPRYG